MKKIFSLILAGLLIFGQPPVFADEVRYDYNENFPEGLISRDDFRGSLRGLSQMDLTPLRPEAKRYIENFEYGSNAAAQAVFSGTGVTITTDNSVVQEGNYSLDAVIDGTGNRSFSASLTMNLSAFTSITLWNRSTGTSDAIRFYVEDSGGDQSYWDITTNGSANTWQQDTLTLASPDGNNGTDADLSDITDYGFQSLDASTTYNFDTIKAIVGMTVAVRGTNLGSYYRHIYNGNQPLAVDAQAAPTITAPTTNPRIDILGINSAGTLAWTTGTEASSPTAPWSTFDSDEIPIALVYMKTTMTSVLDYEDKDTDTNQGYIYADVRPFVFIGSTLRKGADVASASSMTLGNDGNFFDITGVTNITSITAKPAGTVVWLQFDGVLTVTDGSNLKLNGNLTTAAETVLQLVSDGTNWYEVSRQPTAGSFLALSDTPSSYSGQSLKWVRVNGTPNALEFFTATWLLLSDTPSSYSGHGSKTVKVNSGETALEFVEVDPPAWTKIASDTLSSESSTDSFTIVPDKRYMVTLEYNEPTANTDNTIMLRFNSDSTSSYNYSLRETASGASTSAISNNSSTATFIHLGGLRRNSGNAFYRATIEIQTYKNDDNSHSASVFGHGFGNSDGGGGIDYLEIFGDFQKNVTISSFQITTTSAITTADVIVYELNQ